MGFWGGLGKGLLSLVPGGNFISAGLDIAGQLGKGKAQDRNMTNMYNLGQDQLRRQASLDAMQAQLANQQLSGKRLQQGVRGDVVAGLEPVKFNGSGRDLSISGGINPSLISGGTRAMGSLQSRQALLSALGQGGPDDPLRALKPTFTGPTPPAQPGGLEKALNIAGAIGQVPQLLNTQQPLVEDDSWMLGPHE